MFGLNKLQLAQKLPAAMLGTALLVGVGIGTASYFASSATVRDGIYTKLDTLAHERSVELHNYFDDIKADILITANIPSTAEAVKSFSAAYNAIGGNATEVLQKLYIDDNPNAAGEKHLLDFAPTPLAYNTVHKAYHSKFRTQLEIREYYDIFLFDMAGDLVYSVYKEADFATEFAQNSGPWAGSDLGEAFRAGVELAKGEVAFFDFAPYGPSADAPASFMSTAVHDVNGATVGVLAFQMPVGKINHIMNANFGLGETGETFIVGQEGYVLNDLTHNDINDILVTKRDSDVIDIALAGEAARGKGHLLNGELAIESAEPFSFEGVNWAIISEEGQDEAYAPVAEMLNTMLMLGAGLLAVAAAIAFFLSRSITKPLVSLNKTMVSLAEGDLEVEVVGTERNDELGKMAKSVEVFKESGKRVAAMTVETDKHMIVAADHTGQIDAISKSQAVIEFETDGTILRANDNFLNTVGYSLDEIKGRKHVMFVEPEYGQSAEYQQFWENLRNGEYQADEFERFGKGGKTIWIQATYNPIMDQDGKIVKVVKFATDITARKDAIALVASGLRDLADGDLSTEITKEMEGDFGTLKSTFNDTVARLREIVGQLRTTSAGVKTATGEILSGANDLSERTTKQAATIEETSATMEQLAQTVIQNSKSAEDAFQGATAVSKVAEEGGEVMTEATHAMERITSSSSKISNIIGMIDDIAFQTNLLALNASVEAARAGEAGKGFAVVAVEVRRLAQSAAEASSEVKALIEQSAGEVSSGSKLVAVASEKLMSMLASVQSNAEKMNSISTASRQQASSIEEVTSAVRQLDEMTQHNAALVEETNAAIEQTENQASELDRIVEQFRTEGDAPAQRQAAPSAPQAPKGGIQGLKDKVKHAAKTYLTAGNTAVSEDWSEF